MGEHSSKTWFTFPVESFGNTRVKRFICKKKKLGAFANLPCGCLLRDCVVETAICFGLNQVLESDIVTIFCECWWKVYQTQNFRTLDFLTIWYINGATIPCQKRSGNRSFWETKLGLGCGTLRSPTLLMIAGVRHHTAYKEIF